MVPNKKSIVVSSSAEVLAAIEEGLIPHTSLETIRFNEISKHIEENACDYLFMDLEAFGDYGQDPLTLDDFSRWFDSIWQLRPSIDIVLITSPERVHEALRGIKAGARSYLKTPLDPQEVRLITREFFEEQILESERDYLREQFWEADVRDIVRTRCDNMKNVYDLVRSVAPTRTTLLLTGETGTGKSLLAKLIHRHSNRQ